MRQNRYGLFIAILATVVASTAVAQPKDMWIGYFETEWVRRNGNLFEPHSDNCDSTEVFVSVGNSVKNVGFCIEKNERAAESWEDARQTCAALDKRLPEVGEFKYACKHSVGLSNMTGNWEFASNFATTFQSSNGYGIVFVAVAGNSSCSSLYYSYVGSDFSPAEYDRPFRCLR